MGDINKQLPGLRARLNRYGLLALVLCIGLITGTNAGAANLPGLTVIGVAQDGSETLLADSEYRWLVEQDLTYHVNFDDNGNPISDPNTPGFDPNWDNTLSVSFYRTHMPVVAKGCVGFADVGCNELPIPVAGLDPNQHYFVSVLPRSGYTIGGIGFKGGEAPTVYVHQTPLPTAQISVFVFPDTHPVNGAPDTPEEDPATNNVDMSGFQIIVEDGGGRYGAAAGTQSTDVYGNPLGTTYQKNPDGTYVLDPNGNLIIDVMGQGIVTGPDGWAHIYNLAQGKYGIQAVPPDGSGWVQTSTIEGTKIIDAWVKPNEPEFFAEFGPPGPHVFIGFVKEDTETPGGTPVTGQIVNLHMSRPPDYAFYNGAPFGHTTPWVGVNDGTGELIYAAPTDDGNFNIPGLPDGNYELVVWDSALDLIISATAINITGGQCDTPSGSCNLGEVPVFQWFHRQEHYVFNDDGGIFGPDSPQAANGIWDEGEGPLPDVPLNLRWRDGSIYQTNVTDFEGAYAFDQVFPFFSWLVAETGFTRLQATGVTVTVDNGGPIDPDNLWSFGGQLNPQDQTNPATGPGTETADYRVETGPVLTQAFQGFIGQTNAFQWGKRHYPDGENGGITGIVFYDVTRDVNNPQLSAGQVWEPGIPGVTVNLYDATGTTLLNTTVTDSWDASIPTDCKYENSETGPFTFSPDGIHFYDRDCYDGLRNFNQVRPGVFDGGYAFSDYYPGGITVAADGTIIPNVGGETPVTLVPADYVVEVIPPPGYELTKWEDKNVDFGDAYQPPTPALLPPECVGTDTPVPQYLTLYPDENIEVVGWTPGMSASLCDKKLVNLSAGANAAADFFLFTEVPIAAHGVGFILDDTQNEFDPNAPNFGEKYAPPFMPVSIKDWTGREIGRTYSDQYGLYNFLVPSTATTNVPAPSGMSPNMLTACMNDATLPDGSLDPQHNPIYSQFCYTLQYMPGVYTYLDTPVIPVGAFAGPDRNPVDCEFPEATPRIASVSVETNLVGGGPYVPTVTVTNGPPANRGVFPDGDQTITINAMGTVMVPNPDYCNPLGGTCPAGANTTDKLIARDAGFGDTPGSLDLGGVPLAINSWTDAQITATVSANTNIGTVGGRQLTVTRADGGETVTGITVQFGLRGSGSNVGHVVQVYPNPGGNPLASSLQDAIDAAAPNDLLLVNPGIYNEMVIMWKPVQLQGWGEGTTTINALKQPAEKLVAWRALAEQLVTNGDVTLLPGQEVGFGGIEPVTLFNEEGAGILVLASEGGQRRFGLARNRDARIDGFTITGADTGGGIIANGYADYLEISNNRVTSNSGTFGGGIRVGHPLLVNAAQDGYEDGMNDYVRIHNNQVNQNGALDGAGAGISMGAGSDSYQVTDNWVCGNFSTGEGGGIGHIGLSSEAANNDPVPLIARNQVLFNEIFNQGPGNFSGGGIFIGGAPPLLAGTLSPGAGNVRVEDNLIEGNGAGAGDGAGVRLAVVNGQDVADNNNSNAWYGVDLFNNIIVNNVAGLAGGGISLQDAVKVRLFHNTIANNDSLGTAGEAFLDPNQSTPQDGAGIVAWAHSPQLLATGAAIGAFSDPELEDSIVWHNRQFYFKIAAGNPVDPAGGSVWGLCPDIGGTIAGLGCASNDPVYNDLGVIGAAGSLNPLTSILTDATGYDVSNIAADPAFLRPYINGARSDVFQPEITTAIQANPAFDEGGNFIRPNYGPLTLVADPGVSPNLLWDYHIQSASPAVDAGSIATPPADFDGDSRTASPDIGADEYQTP
ncbi:hypothetical protein DSCO28_61850 [Desulfosarcina ovata subsp. sediminis]|uniref:Uncharacterized protein n=1 Tax=Desulfosarcina ovata subsp. sediminis TaxID=885957 RepID=A0A5K7ZZB4_9BACT|nr:right-handed parallel beta-helix repeat-containing protein [Desulfosarcina ovata]BBO85619.1 hypothetical protein DSCO28_61850 [Desulfosarcina ovata subsp. sediminis]